MVKEDREVLEVEVFREEEVVVEGDHHQVVVAVAVVEGPLLMVALADKVVAAGDQDLKTQMQLLLGCI